MDLYTKYQDAWTEHMNKKSPVVHDSLKLTDSIINLLQSNGVITKGESHKLLAVNESDETTRALKFTGFLRDDVSGVNFQDLITILQDHRAKAAARVFRDFAEPRGLYTAPRPPPIPQNPIIQVERSSPPVQPPGGGARPQEMMTPGSAADNHQQSLWVSQIQLRRDDFRRNMELTDGRQLPILVQHGCINPEESVRIAKIDRSQMPDRVDELLTILGQRAPPYGRLLNELIFAFDTLLDQRTADIFKNMRDCMMGR